MLKVKVSNMEGGNGNPVPNQFIITTDTEEYFQSYQSVIAYRPFDPKSVHVEFFAKYPDAEKSIDAGIQILPSVYLDCNKWDYSVTTGRYRNQFLGETKKETQAKIDSGEYALVDLN